MTNLWDDCVEALQAESDPEAQVAAVLRIAGPRIAEWVAEEIDFPLGLTYRDAWPEIQLSLFGRSV